jgi:ribonuclease P protein component
MLKKLYRLRQKRDIEAVFQKGKGVYDSRCGIKFKRNGLPYSRFTVVVGTKVDKRAVQRNRIKRQYRELLRRHHEKIAPGYDIMLLTSKPAVALTFEEKEEALLHVFKKAQLYARI